MLPYSKIFKNHRLFVSLYSTIGEANYFAHKKFDLLPQWLKNYDVIEYATKKRNSHQKLLCKITANCTGSQNFDKKLVKDFSFLVVPG